MSGLSYVGTAPATSPDITNKLAVDTVVATTTPNQSWATAQAQSIAAATYATLAYVDTQDATFATPAYVAAQDALYVPNTAVGTALSTEQLLQDGFRFFLGNFALLNEQLQSLNNIIIRYLTTFSTGGRGGIAFTTHPRNIRRWLFASHAGVCHISGNLGAFQICFLLQ